MREARREGASFRALAEVAGVSRQRVAEPSQEAVSVLPRGAADSATRHRQGALTALRGTLVPAEIPWTPSDADEEPLAAGTKATAPG
jgi:hypothetical protein